MDIDYGPALRPHLDSHGRVDDASGFNVSSVEEPSAQPKKTYHSSKQYAVAPSSASDHYSDDSDEPRPAPSRAKKHTDKSKPNPGPDIYLLPQRRISPLRPDIGLQNLGRPTLIKTILNMTQTLLTTGK